MPIAECGFHEARLRERSACDEERDEALAAWNPQSEIRIPQSVLSRATRRESLDIHPC
jgi:hypothetical protein